jgi:hypothetical protein
MSVTFGVKGEQKLPQAESTQQKFIEQKRNIGRNGNHTYSVEEAMFN